MKNWILALLVVLTGCAQVPDTAPRNPLWYETTADLADKEQALWESTLEQVDRSGLLIYDALLPWTDEDRYLESHNIADAPAWHGCLMAAVAFKEAVTGEDQDATLARLAGGLEAFFAVTGEPGLLGRSMVADYSGPRLDWMDTEEERPSKYWQQGPTGAWYRNGLAKNHLNQAMFGCSVPLALEKRGEIALDPETRAVLVRVLLTCVRRLAEDGYRILEADGSPTEFGDLRPAVVPAEYLEMARPYVGFLPWDLDEDDLDKLSAPVNGFNSTIVLSMLRAAGEHDAGLLRRYMDEGEAWAPWIGRSLRALGFVVSRIGHYRIGKPSYSDIAAYGQAAMALLLYDESSPVAEAVRSGLKGLWTFAEHERNPMIAFSYAQFIDPVPTRIDELVQDLRDFPVDKHAHYGPKEQTNETQPLGNRDMSSHYWKSDPNEKVTGPQDRDAGRRFSGQDYLLAYWWGRWAGLVPER